MMLVPLFSVAACGEIQTQPPPRSTSEAFPLTIDSCGRQVVINSPRQSVLTVASVAAPLVAAAGGAGKIVARTFETASFPGEYADELAAVPLVSRTEELSREAIIARKPDLVITYEGSDNAPQDLEAAGIPVYIPKSYCTDNAQGDYEAIFADIELVGRLLGTQDAAGREAATLRERVSAVEKTSSGTPQRRSAAALIFGRGTPTISAYGNPSTVDQQMEILGLTNVFRDVDERVFDPTIEDIITRNPDIVILLTQGDQTPEGVRESLRNRPELRGITAISNDRIIVLPAGFILPSPVAVQGLEVLAQQLAQLT